MIVDAAVGMSDLATYLKLSAEAFSLEEGAYHSLGGFVLASLGHIPKEGESFNTAGYTFEILDMDRFRIDKVAIRKILSSESPTLQ